MYYPYAELIFRKKYNENEEYLNELRNRLKRYKEEAEDLINNWINAGEEAQYFNQISRPWNTTVDKGERPHVVKIMRDSYVQDLRNIIARDLDNEIKLG